MTTVAEARALQQQLCQMQNPDGGWGFNGGSSWTEPTALALLALSAHVDGTKGEILSGGYQWLDRSQRHDGGWAPQPGVDVSTWVTSLVTLALLLRQPSPKLSAALACLKGQVKAPESPVQRLVRRLQTGPVWPEIGGASSWFPGTAGWLYPTAMAALAFSRVGSQAKDKEAQALGLNAEAYILSRRCRDGGWNHGGSRYLSEDAFSYPEMTGVALLALEHVDPDELRYPLKRAATFLQSPNSSEGHSWLRMALVKHNWPPTECESPFPCRTTRDKALRLLALSASSPRNILVCPHS